MKEYLIILSVITLSFAFGRSFGQDSLWQKEYTFGVYNNYDLRNSSTNAIGLFRVLNDGFESNVASGMKPGPGKLANDVFTFATVYLVMLWSHEFGHYLRAEQVGGKFNFHNFGLPVPYTTASLPTSISLTDESIFVTAGFEVNYLNVRQLQAEFIRQNGIPNRDLSFSFANRLFYPIYTSLVAPVNPKDRNTWIETKGDPVHFILPVYKNHSHNNVFLQDSSVNSDLVNLYNEANLFAYLTSLLDPQFYRELGAAFGSASKSRKPIFLIGDYNNGWTYGTLFNASPLGYELYFQNYLHIRDHHYGLYFKYGRPFKNLGLGLAYGLSKL
jgi:hypothetical protein